MSRVFNFSAGPAVLPESVLRQAADEMLDWHGSGMSVMEMSHRGKEFIAIHAEAEALLRELLAIPTNYKVLFLQGGAIGENAIVPMNLLRGKASADYINTGEWSKKSIEEAQALLPRSTSPPAPRRAASPACRRATAGSSTPTPPTCTSAPTRPSAASSTTGRPIPATCRWSPTCRRNILSRPVDVARYGLIYAGAQKNIGPAGLTIVIVRDDLIGQAHCRSRRSAFDYKQPGRQRLDAQHPAHLRDLHRRPGVPLDQGARAAWRRSSRAQPRQGGAAVRLPRRRAASTATRWRAPTAR